jgi:hypothetical protein
LEGGADDNPADEGPGVNEIEGDGKGNDSVQIVEDAGATDPRDDGETNGAEETGMDEEGLTERLAEGLEGLEGLAETGPADDPGMSDEGGGNDSVQIVDERGLDDGEMYVASEVDGADETEGDSEYDTSAELRIVKGGATEESPDEEGAGDETGNLSVQIVDEEGTTKVGPPDDGATHVVEVVGVTDEV